MEHWRSGRGRTGAREGGAITSPQRFRSSRLNCSSSLKFRHTDANRTSASLSIFRSSRISISPILLVEHSRSWDSVTSDSAALTLSCTCAMVTVRFLQARKNRCGTFRRSNRSRRLSFLPTSYGMPSMRRYDVMQRPHPRQRRRRLIESPSLLIRESMPLALRREQKGQRTDACGVSRDLVVDPIPSHPKAGILGAC